MRGPGVTAFLMVLTLADVVPTRARDIAAPAELTYWRVVYSALEIEKETAFLTAGSKLGVTGTAGEMSLFIAGSQGNSLSDGERARRFGWPADRSESQTRLMAGFERSTGKVFVSLAVGVAQARMQRLRQPDPLLRLMALAGVQSLEARHVSALLAGLPPSILRSQMPPSMKTFTGGLVDLSLWYRPNDTDYVHWSLVGDSAAQSLWTRLRAGTRLAGLPFAIGPEAATAVGRNWHKYKLGLHLGDVSLWRFGLAAAAGWITDETRRSGAYASFSLHAKF